MPSRWCGVSDIDGTILNTLRGCLPKFLEVINTFLKHPQPINGMPEPFNRIRDDLPYLRFWYVSASPHRIMPHFSFCFSLKEYIKGEIVIPTRRKAIQIYLIGLVY
jgi:phosphatidate phosphatase APP1